MKYEIGGFIIWVIVYSSIRLSVMKWVSTDYWFFMGCIAGILCVAITKIVAHLREEE